MKRYQRVLSLVGLVGLGCAIQPDGELNVEQDTERVLREDSDPREKEQAISGWSMPSNGWNVGSFDYGWGWGCLQQKTTNDAAPYIVCYAVGETIGGKVAEASFTGNLPANGIKKATPPKAIAVSNPNYMSGKATLYVLGEDSVVRSSIGIPTATQPIWASRGDFQTFSVAVEAKTSAGAAICISKIVNVGTPGYYGPTTNLIGLGCDDLKIYYATNKRWKLVDASAPAWAAVIPNASNQFTDISHGGTLGGYLLERNSGRVFMFGNGTYDHDAMRANLVFGWLPALPSSFKAVAVGGPFVLTDSGNGRCDFGAVECRGDENRVFRYNASTGRWARPTGHQVPSPPGVSPDNQVLPWRGITDGYGFGGNEDRYFIWDHRHRLYEGTP